MPGSVKRNLVTGGLLALLVVLADQVTKEWALATLFRDGAVVEVTPFFNLVAVWNRGVSFGLLASDDPMTPFYLSGFAVAVVIGLTVWLARAPTQLLRISLGLIIGGAVGNVYDRVKFGAVADFFSFHIDDVFYWYIFNIADVWIVAGVGLMLVDAVFPGKEPDSAEK